MKKTSIKKMYYYTLISDILSLTIGIAGGLIVLIFLDEFVGKIGVAVGIALVCVIVAMFFSFATFSIIDLIVLFKDYKALKNSSFISVTGKVLRFERNTEPESGAQINDKPVILDLDTGGEIKLNINDKIAIGETYEFVYLKNCKIAEIVNKI